MRPFFHDWKNEAFHRKIVNFLFEILSFRLMRACNKLNRRPRHECGSSPILPLHTPSCFHPILPYIWGPMLRIIRCAPMPGKNMIVMHSIVTESATRSRPESKHVIAAVTTLECIVVQYFPNATRLPFQMLDG